MKKFTTLAAVLMLGVSPLAQGKNIEFGDFIYQYMLDANSTEPYPMVKHNPFKLKFREGKRSDNAMRVYFVTPSDTYYDDTYGAAAYGTTAKLSSNAKKRTALDWEISYYIRQDSFDDNSNSPYNWIADLAMLGDYAYSQLQDHSLITKENLRKYGIAMQNLCNELHLNGMTTLTVYKLTSKNKKDLWLTERFHGGSGSGGTTYTLHHNKLSAYKTLTEYPRSFTSISKDEEIKLQQCSDKIQNS
ncbi:hypothetical protein B0181_03630 [Moraxella caviae]|uniref:Uncharacterized protein n=1 Tax=Moraxella caviae TaxID=34060 RepID=A0A1T0A626_9GAMM|nr:hypothetical protein [Moraxella caviae]OOR91185.1 hypothetical protein B0181_03630 [Moraxella caviae]STZ13778.1 Uncharacterised protein [Moraxella caviae]VEW13012.1 Uncharacterised protein [Moraxella caviae]